MRIAIFTDIHGNKEALKAIIKDTKKEKIDEVICLGDVVAIGPNPSECLDMIIDKKIKLILGNHELYVTRGPEIDEVDNEEVIEHEKWVRTQINNEELLYLNSCPLYIEKEINGKKILFIHFPMIDINLDYPYYDFDIIENKEINKITKSLKYDLIFVGHEHKAFTVDNKLYCIGSSGCVKDNMTKYTILDTETFEIKTKNVKFNWNRFLKDLKKKDYPYRKEIAEHFYGVDIK